MYCIGGETDISVDYYGVKQWKHLSHLFQSCRVQLTWQDSLGKLYRNIRRNADSSDEQEGDCLHVKVPAVSIHAILKVAEFILD